jgi:hypothetical protein
MSNQALIKRFTPVIWIHPDEKYFPCSIEWLLQHSKLVDFNTNTTISPVTQRDLYTIAQTYGFGRRADGDVVLSWSEDMYKGQTPLSSVPCYALVRETNDYIYISYIFLFAYNGEYSILGLAEAGMHPGDIEHITVEVDKRTDALHRVYFSAHGTKDGRWVPANEVEIDNDRIVAYNALNGHGLYPHVGTVFRLGGVANDYLDKGFLWEPRAKEFFLNGHPNFDVNTMGFFAYNSRVGGSDDKPNTEGITGIPDKGWIQNIDNPDPAFYNPPNIYSPKADRIAYVARNFVRFAILYFLVYACLKLVTRISKGKTVSPFGWKQHFLTIVLVAVLYKAYTTVGMKLIHKYAPS